MCFGVNIFESQVENFGQEGRVFLVQFSYSGRKSEMDFSNRGLTNILLTMLSKDTLYRIIFKLVLLFHKYCIS